MRLQDIPVQVLSACEEMELEDAQIEALSPRQLFVKFCEWEGLINWGDTLWGIVEKLKAGEQSDPNSLTEEETAMLQTGNRMGVAKSLRDRLGIDLHSAAKILSAKAPVRRG
jgi:hypothetical protein